MRLSSKGGREDSLRFIIACNFLSISCHEGKGERRGWLLPSLRLEELFGASETLLGEPEGHWLAAQEDCMIVMKMLNMMFERCLTICSN